jgi:group I intron endonuclease
MRNVIYKIRNVVNDKFYVGSTTNTETRFKDHRRRLRKGKHHCKHLQAAWNKYGEDCFKFEVIEVVKDDSALWNAENVWLTQWVGRPECYNSGRSAEAPNRGLPKEENPLTGRVRPPEVNAQVSQTLKEHYAENEHPRQGKKHTSETLAKIAANRTPPRGENHYRYGKTVSEETRKKIGDAQRGVAKGPRTYTEEGRAKIRAAAEAGRYNHWEGRRHSEASKEKMGRAVIATDPAGVEHRFATITQLRKELGLPPPTVDRALKSGNNLTKGKAAGWSFRYEPTPLTQQSK